MPDQTDVLARPPLGEVAGRQGRGGPTWRVRPHWLTGFVTAPGDTGADPRRARVLTGAREGGGEGYHHSQLGSASGGARAQRAQHTARAYGRTTVKFKQIVLTSALTPHNKSGYPRTFRGLRSSRIRSSGDRSTAATAPAQWINEQDARKSTTRQRQYKHMEPSKNGIRIHFSRSISGRHSLRCSQEGEYLQTHLSVLYKYKPCRLCESIFSG